MKLSQYVAYLALATSTVHAASLPKTDALSLTDNAASIPRSDLLAPENALEKRKGGGGKGGGSSGGSSGGKSGGTSSSGAPATGRTSGASNVGGATSAGSGPARAYGGGGYYGGGSSKPYQSGKGTPKGLIAGAVLAPTLALAIFPGLWLYSVYPYYYHNPYRFYNQSRHNDTDQRRQEATGQNVSLPVVCLCQDYSVCGCDENSDQSYIDDLVGNGSYAALNHTLATVSDVNGTETLVLNGTLPNGTTSPGGEDDEVASSAASVLVRYSGYWVMVMIVLTTVTAL